MAVLNSVLNCAATSGGGIGVDLHRKLLPIDTGIAYGYENVAFQASLISCFFNFTNQDNL